MKIFILFTILILNLFCYSQERFILEELENSKKYGEKIQKSFNIYEKDHFIIDSSQNKEYLKNGLRSSKYINKEHFKNNIRYKNIKSINIVFSKYPIRNGQYQMNHKLLFNRLKNLFEIAPLLNNNNYEWNIILHSNCKNDKQVDSLYHGVIIEYITEKTIKPIIELKDTIIKRELKQKPTDSYIIPSAQSSLEILEKLESFVDLPIDVSEDLKSRTPIEKTEILIDYFEKQLEDTSITKITSKKLQKYEHLIKKFIKTYSNNNDDLVYKVFDRNKDWKNTLVVSDWTGSMYSFGAQALLWHTLNFEKSGIEYISLFNDGDNTNHNKKKIGETNGIYFEKANNIEKVLKLYQLVMLKGSGGDGPENDIEGILKAIEKYPNHSEVVLIADNNACVRDINLLEFIKEPIKVILCGYDNKIGINPQYLKIASKTHGSIHLIEHDIYNLQVKLDNKGKIIKLADYDYKINKSACINFKNFHNSAYFDSITFTSLEKVLKYKFQAKNLNLSSNSLIKIPKEIKKLKNIQSINLSNNQIKRVSSSIYKSQTLMTLDLSKNKIEKVSNKIEQLFILKELNLSHNKIDTITFKLKFGYLKYLNLSYNNISYLSKNIKLKNIEFLYLNNNNLQHIPDNFSRFKHLKELNLSNNQLTKVNQKITYLKKLEILDISNNKLKSLPKYLTRLKKLKTLKISGNNFSEEYILELKKLLPKVNIS